MVFDFCSFVLVVADYFVANRVACFCVRAFLFADLPFVWVFCLFVWLFWVLVCIWFACCFVISLILVWLFGYW